MSTPAPIVAPWISNWTRYPVQVVPMVKQNKTLYELDVPANQWWRVIYSSGQWFGGAGGGNRAAFFTAVPPHANGLAVPAPGTLTDGVVMTAVFTLGVSSYTGAFGTSSMYGVAAIPDIIWPPLTELEMSLAPGGPNDNSPFEPVLAYELYVESYNEQQQIVLTPAPTLT